MGALIAKLYRSLFSQQEVKLLLVGLDSAGKTTVLYRLKLGEVVAVIPTSGYNVETVTHKNYYITMWDFGGRNQIRPLWRDHSKDTQGVIFVIDSNDMERMEEASNELKRM
jgi:ADP-ribosylation factor protein 1